jgi:pimeloyl-ACP methyl ester carboxylesterase
MTAGIGIALTVGLACDTRHSAVDVTDPSNHHSSFVTANGVRLNVLVWGTGAATPLILVHGLGGSPHDFDAIADSVREDRRVIAYARRGHGRSEHRGPLDPQTFAEDLRQLMDALSIREAYLGGASMGSLEITTLAATFPDRVKGLVYLEGFDWSDSLFAGKQALFPPLDLSPAPSDLASFDAYYKWFLANWLPDIAGSPTIRAAVHDYVVLDSAGAVRVPTDTLTSMLFKIIISTPLAFHNVKAPALVLVAERMWPLQVGDSLRPSVAAWNNAMAMFKRSQIARMMREMPHVDTLTIRGVTHASIGMDPADGVGVTIRRFLRAREF